MILACREETLEPDQTPPPPTNEIPAHLLSQSRKRQVHRHQTRTITTLLGSHIA